MYELKQAGLIGKATNKTIINKLHGLFRWGEKRGFSGAILTSIYNVPKRQWIYFSTPQDAKSFFSMFNMIIMMVSLVSSL
jgi:hypothetical protein